MSTRSVIATGTADNWKGRYVHWDGYPTAVGRAVQEIMRRDGYAKATKVLLNDHYGWSSVDGQIGGEVPESLQDERFVQVSGYGVAYREDHGESNPDEWFTSDSANPLWIEWVYILTPTNIVVLKGDYRENTFREVGETGFDDEIQMVRIEDAVYAV